MEDQVICLRDANGDPYWQIVVNDKIMPATWRQPGPAAAGIDVERRRQEKRKRP